VIKKIIVILNSKSKENRSKIWILQILLPTVRFSYQRKSRSVFTEVTSHTVVCA